MINTDSIFPERPQFAGFWERFAAAFIDGIVIGALNVAIRLTIGDSIFETEFNFRNTLITYVVYWLYFAIQESGSRQATLGKRAMNIQVCNMSYGRITFWQATGRHFAKYISGIILLIGYLMMLWDDQKQTLHDKMARTLVVASNS